MAYISEVTPMAIAYKSNDLVDGRVNTAVECSTANNPDELWTSVKMQSHMLQLCKWHTMSPLT